MVLQGELDVEAYLFLSVFVSDGFSLQLISISVS